MKTRITRSPRLAGKTIQAGGVVAFPTETVYGLGADAFCEPAVEAIFRAKGRPQDNPLIVHLSEASHVEQVAAQITPAAQAAMNEFFPGPLTVVVPRHPDLPLTVTAGLDTVGIRCPDHPVAQALLQECGCPVAAPSANRSGRPSPTTWQAVAEELDGRVDAILKGEVAQIGLESTVIDCTHSCPVLLRAGAISLEQLQEIWPAIRLASSSTREGPARSPGMNHRHYAPTARVQLIASPAELPPDHAAVSAYIGLDRDGFPGRPRRLCVCENVTDYARQLFHFFRVCEKAGISRIYCQSVPEKGLGHALMDRIRRAAEGDPMCSNSNYGQKRV